MKKGHLTRHNAVKVALTRRRGDRTRTCGLLLPKQAPRLVRRSRYGLGMVLGRHHRLHPVGDII